MKLGFLCIALKDVNQPPPFSMPSKLLICMVKRSPFVLLHALFPNVYFNYLFHSDFLRFDMLRIQYKAPAKRSQYANATCRNIVGRNLLRCVSGTCCVLLAQI